MEHMSTEKTWQIHSRSSEDTEALGERIGARLKGGEVIELVSDLGGGKTTFTRGLVRGAGSADRVASPTFTVSREYRASKFTIFHFDFYRMHDAGVVAEELREYVGAQDAVVVVEWGDIVDKVLPTERLRIQFFQAREDGRDIHCTYPHELMYLLEGINA
jgi:tRNA threonylcarbamoyladenosine biosynthesis protein TsaE